MTTNRPLKVFLCHSSADKPAVRELYEKLRAEAWIQPWLDEEELFPGMDWNLDNVYFQENIYLSIRNNKWIQGFDSITKVGA